MGPTRTPFGTPTKQSAAGACARPRWGAPSHPPSSIDRVLYRADSKKKDVRFSARPSTLKAFSAIFFARSAKYYDELISQLIGEVSRG